MKSRSLKSVIILFVFLFFCLSLSLSTSDFLRAKSIGLFSPFWSLFQNDRSSLSQEEEKSFLKLQLELLKKENKTLKEINSLKDSTILPSTEAIPARVIFRSPASWNSTLWINVGSKSVSKNSPVVFGNHVVGVIDYVEEHRSKVRLITDSALTPSVRAVREGNYLAKGELYGSSQPLWRTQSKVLKGVGFNYDFSDDKGPARDLRTGKTFNQKGESFPLLMVNDLLVTTGMDGVFPPDLSVATVTKIFPLKEGDFAYEIEAIPTVPDLDTLSLVFVLPPI